MSDFFKSVILLAIGVFLKHLWDKVQNRIVHLNYSVWHKNLGTNVYDNLFGHVQITYNGNPVSNLYFSTIVVENNSNRDLEKIDLNIFADTGSVILMSFGAITSSPNALKFTDEYSQLLAQAQNDNQAFTSAVGRRDYNIPVLNRGDKVNIQMLVSNGTKEPLIFCSCDRAGIKMKLVSQLKNFFGESSVLCARLGIFVSLIACWPIIAFTSSSYLFLGIIAGTVVGLLAMFWGLILVKLYRVVVRIFG